LRRKKFSLLSVTGCDTFLLYFNTDLRRVDVTKEKEVRKERVR
jgi:hypothetical protein